VRRPGATIQSFELGSPIHVHGATTMKRFGKVYLYKFQPYSCLIIVYAPLLIEYSTSIVPMNARDQASLTTLELAPRLGVRHPLPLSAALSSKARNVRVTSGPEAGLFSDSGPCSTRGYRGKGGRGLRSPSLATL